MKNKIEKVVFLYDQHAPFHDKQTHKTVLKLLAYIKPDFVYLGGDLVDFFDISNFVKDINKRFHMQEGIDEAIEVLKDYRRVVGKKCPMVFIRGNHERRLERYKNEHPEIADLKGMDISEVLRLKELNVELCATHARKHRDFMIVHGDDGNRFGSKYVAAAKLQKYRMSGVSGHTHKADTWTESSPYTGDKVWNVLGCLADIKAVSADYMPDANWNQSIGIAEFSDNRFSFHNLLIVRHKTILNGQLFEP